MAQNIAVIGFKQGCRELLHISAPVFVNPSRLICTDSITQSKSGLLVRARWGWTIFGLKFHYVLPLYRKQMQRTIEMSTYIFFIFSVKVQTMECKFLLWPPPSLWSGSIFTHLDHMHSCHLLLYWRGTQLGFNKSRKMKTLNWKQPRADQV